MQIPMFGMPVNMRGVFLSHRTWTFQMCVNMRRVLIMASSLFAYRSPEETL
jgi:hypothetical protein